MTFEHCKKLVLKFYSHPVRPELVEGFLERSLTFKYIVLILLFYIPFVKTLRQAQGERRINVVL